MTASIVLLPWALHCWVGTLHHPLRVRAAQGWLFPSWSHMWAPVHTHGSYGMFVLVSPPPQVIEFKWYLL